MQIVLTGSWTRFVCSDQCTSLWAVPDVMSSAGRAQNRDKAETHGAHINEKRVEEHEVWECYLVADMSFGMYAVLFEYICFPSWLYGWAKRASDVLLVSGWRLWIWEEVALSSPLLGESGFRYSFSLQKISSYPNFTLCSTNFLPGLVLISECSVPQTCEFQGLALVWICL